LFVVNEELMDIYIELLRSLEEALRVWERKFLRKVYGPKRDTHGWRIRTNKELTRSTYKC
jgi:hypothetical protein